MTGQNINGEGSPNQKFSPTLRLLLHGSMLSISSEVEEKWYTAIIIGRDFAERCVKHDRLKICTVNDENGSLKSLISETRWSEWGDSNSRHLEPKSSALPTGPHPDACRALYTIRGEKATRKYVSTDIKGKRKMQNHRNVRIALTGFSKWSIVNLPVKRRGDLHEKEKINRG